MSGGAAGERLNRTRLGIRVPGCSVAWGLGGLGPAICRGEFLLKERSRSIVAQTVAVGRCLEFLLLPFIDRIVTLYSSLLLFERLPEALRLGKTFGICEHLKAQIVGFFLSFSRLNPFV